MSGRSLFSALVGLGLVLLCAGLGLAKEKPVPGVMEMFNNFNELEESFRKAKWDEAMTITKKVEADYLKLVPSLKNTVDAKTIQKFTFLIGSFKKKIEEKDSEAIEKHFVNLQSLFLDIMDLYAYDKPPALLIAARYVGEAAEALEKADFDDVGDEMDEIMGFKDRITKALTGMGGAPQAFFDLVEKVEKKAKAKDKEGSEAALAELKAFLQPYVPVPGN